jgi:ribosomal protein L37AE/L43A
MNYIGSPYFGILFIQEVDFTNKKRYTCSLCKKQTHHLNNEICEECNNIYQNTIWHVSFLG